MKYNLLFIILLLFNFGCVKCHLDVKRTYILPKKEVLPIKIKLSGVLRQLDDNIGMHIPDIQFNIDTNNVEVKIGTNEFYNIDYKNTALDKIFDRFEIGDFDSNRYFYNPYFLYLGYMETEKEIDGENYVRKFSNHRRTDIDVDYFALDSIEIANFALLSNYLNEIAIDILKDKVDRRTMITARSMSEALANPEKVYKLRLRNSKTRVLPSTIGELINLRVLDISGSRIKSIPPEIEHCIHLKTIIANASQLSEIPSTIGQLKKLRNINFGACKIKELPEEFGKLESLWSLSLGSNQLSDLPESMSNLKNLTMFSIDKNNFDEFPKEVLDLETVGTLWMHGNNFKTIPSEIVNLKQLHHFLVDAHEIENIEEIKSLLPEVRIIDEIERYENRK